jgi:outer membrane protein, heavy metal efflux system
LDESITEIAGSAAERIFPEERAMNARTRVVLSGAAGIFYLLSLPVSCLAQETTLTLPQALEMARKRAPVVLSARARIEEARGRLKGASVLFQQNPAIDVAAGPRISNPERFTDVDVALSQEMELGGRRKSRMAGAQAGIEREIADSGEATRRLLREVAVAFSRALAAQERVRLLTGTGKLAEEFLQIADRRYRAGDIAVLELNLARTSLARTRAELRVAEADLSRELGALRVLLGMKPRQSLAVTGELAERAAYEETALMAGALDGRPDFKALKAELREAESDIRLGDGFKWPDLGFTARYKKDTGDNVYQGGVKLTLPVFSRGQELRATGSARASRVQLEMEALQNAVQHEVSSAFETYQRRIEASRELEGGALPSLVENENLAKRSYEEGEIGAAELLLIRRDSLETRLAYVSNLLEAKLAEIELQFRAGVLQ